MKRLFVAIVFEEETKDYLYGIQQEVMTCADKGKFHLKDNFHLTVEFIGMVPEKFIPPLWRKIEDLLIGRESFEINLSHLGAFYKKNKAIPWVGIENSPPLFEIQDLVMKAVGSVIEHAESHHYTPHISLGRQVVMGDLPKIDVQRKVLVKEIALMESSSKTGVLLYTPLKSHQLL